MAPTLTLNVSPPGGGGSYPASTAHGALMHPAYQSFGGSFTPPDGTNATLPGRGFSDSDVYILATDSNGDMIFEPGPECRVWYFTAGPNGYTAAEIAAIEGEDPSVITEDWVAGQTRWGATEAEPLAWAEFHSWVFRLWAVANPYSGGWMLLERGYDYGGQVIHPEPAQGGSSALHPCVFGAWGTGTQPNFLEHSTFSMGGVGGNHRHLAWSDMRTRPMGFTTETSRNILFSGITVQGPFAPGSALDIAFEPGGVQSAANRQHHITFYKSKFFQVSYSSPPNGTWDSDRGSGILARFTDYVCVYNCTFDEVGWDRSYDPIAFDPAAGHPPNQFNHCVYFQKDSGEIIFRENIVARGSASGVQARCGGRFMRNFFSDNNIDHQIFHGGSEGTGDTIEGNWATYFVSLGDIHVSGANKVSQGNNGQGGSKQEQAGGVDWVGQDVLIINGADPLDASDVSGKAGISGIVPNAGLEHFKDIVVANWFQQADQNAGGISQANLDACTIGQFVDDQQSVAAGTNTTEDALDWLRAQPDPIGLLNDMRDWFASRTGIRRFVRTVPEYVTFQPWRVADGFAWDTYMNWSSRDIPGTDVASDWVSLGGWTVHSYETNCQLAELQLATGALTIFGGKTTVTNLAGAGTVTLENAGQLWIGGAASGAKDVIVNGGRVAFTGNLSNFVSFTINGDAENPPEFVVRSGQSVTIGAAETLTLNGPNLRAILDGIDGGTATLTIAGTLAFVAGSGAVPSIQEGRSGIYGLNPATDQPHDPNVASAVVLEAGSTVNVDTTGLAPGTYTLIEADTLTDNGATLPSGVAVNGNRLEVTV